MTGFPLNSEATHMTHSTSTNPAVSVVDDNHKATYTQL